jgi:outer membrane biosynthesis protein TonB
MLFSDTMKYSAIVLALALLSAGCKTTRAQTPLERPVLDVPPAPPRVIDPAPPPELPQPEPVPELPPEKAPPPPKPRPQPRETAKPENAKPETPADSTPPPVPQPPPPQLRTPATADVATADRRIRDSLRSTESTLNTIDYKKLKPERQSAYNQAKSSMEGAEAALKAQNFELAKEMADKAEKLAKELQGR